MTFRTFMSPETLFDMIVDRYREDHPKDLNSSLEFDNWRRHNIASQRRALMILTMWLEDHRLLEEEPHIAQRLTAFLKLIITPPLAEDAQRLMDSIERLVRVRDCLKFTILIPVFFSKDVCRPSSGSFPCVTPKGQEDPPTQERPSQARSY